MKNRFTDLFIRRPVLAIVVSLLIFFVGLKSYTSLEVRQFPRYDAAQISVTTGYPGASPSLMQGFITTPIEQAISFAINKPATVASDDQWWRLGVFRIKRFERVPEVISVPEAQAGQGSRV